MTEILPDTPEPLTPEELSKAIWGPDARTTINGTVETVHVGDELVAVIDRDPKYKLDLKSCTPGYRPMPSPTEEQIASPLFQAIWQAIKTWDVNVPEFYDLYCEANGSHVLLIMNSINGVADDK